MTLPIVWDADALHDLEAIVEYIAVRNADAAQRLGDAIRHTADGCPIILMFIGRVG